MVAKVKLFTARNCKEFRDKFAEYGSPRFVIMEEEDREFMKEHQWAIGNDLNLVFKKILSWEKRNCHFVYKEPSDEDRRIYGDELEGGWVVFGLTEYFQEAFRFIKSPSATACQKEVEDFFFKAIYDEGYGFFCMDTQAGNFEQYLTDWEEEEKCNNGMAK